jgi:hypothetical protein
MGYRYLADDDIAKQLSKTPAHCTSETFPFTNVTLISL